MVRICARSLSYSQPHSNIQHVYVSDAWRGIETVAKEGLNNKGVIEWRVNVSNAKYQSFRHHWGTLSRLLCFLFLCKHIHTMNVQCTPRAKKRETERERTTHFCLPSFFLWHLIKLLLPFTGRGFTQALFDCKACVAWEWKGSYALNTTQRIKSQVSWNRHLPTAQYIRTIEVSSVKCLRWLCPWECFWWFHRLDFAILCVFLCQYIFTPKANSK